MEFWTPFLGSLAGAFIGVVSGCIIVYYLARPKKRDLETYDGIRQDVEQMEGDEAYKSYLEQTNHW